ncbi:Reverse transcriptase (RNA-dependent DNA polymerase) [Fragilaria crotonensis]|nr:Reverse transcriptase (RNA-dependent DNA polymerase) [Fragilaria crotonensis]
MRISPAIRNWKTLLGTPSYEPYDDDDEGGFPVPPDDDEADPDTYDQYVGAEVVLPIGDTMMSAKVRGRKRQHDGTLVGKANPNPILDTRTYEVEFMDGQKAELTANVIAQNMYAQCDSEGNQYLLLAGIVGHRKDNSAVEKKDMYIRHGSNLQLRKTTKDGAYASNGRMGVPPGNGSQALRSQTLWKLQTTPSHVIAAVNKRYHKTHKFGIKIPKSYDDCVRIQGKW